MMSRHDVERDHRRLMAATRALAIAQPELPESIFRTVDMYVHCKYKNTEHLVPESVRNWERGCSYTVFAPVFDIERRDDPRQVIRSLEITLGVPKYEATKGQRVEYTFKVAKLMEFDRNTSSRYLAERIQRSAVDLIQEYQSWAIKEYLGVKDACLHTWDEEIIHTDTGKAHNLLKGDGHVRSKIGILLMEDEDGTMSVQLFQSPDKMLDSYNQLSGSPGGKSQRATMLNLDYDGTKVVVDSKMLPDEVDLKNRPDMHVLGHGPAKFATGWMKKVKEEFKEFTQ